MSADLAAADVLADVIALVSAALEPERDGRDELLDGALEAVFDGLAELRGDEVAPAAAALVYHLLDRLASATGRDRDELWQEIARALTARTTQGEPDE
jgi:hypothetical protein